MNMRFLDWTSLAYFLVILEILYQFYSGKFDYGGCAFVIELLPTSLNNLINLII